MTIDGPEDVEADTVETRPVPTVKAVRAINPGALPAVTRRPIRNPNRDTGAGTIRETANPLARWTTRSPRAY